MRTPASDSDKAKPMMRQKGQLRPKSGTLANGADKEFSLLHGPSGGIRKTRVGDRLEEMKRATKSGRKTKPLSNTVLGYTKKVAM